MKKSNPSSSQGSNQWLALLNLGWLFLIQLLVCAGGGMWLDRRFKTAPILLLVGVILGFISCGYTLYGAVKKLERDEAKKPEA